MIRSMHSSDLAAVTAIEQLVQTHPWKEQQFKESIDSYHSTVIEQQG